MRNYDETRRDFRWPAPEHFNFADDVVGRWASKDGASVAMRWIGDGGERTITFRQFAERLIVSRTRSRALACVPATGCC